MDYVDLLTSVGLFQFETDKHLAVKLLANDRMNLY